MAAAEELEKSLTDAAAATGRSLVRVGRDGRGLGWIRGPGLVVTSGHHVRGDEITVAFVDGRQVIGEVKGVDPDGDLAVVAVDTGDAPGLQWSDTATRLGQLVVVPGLLPGNSATRVTWGLVSALGAAFRGPSGRLISEAFEHTAPVARGSSGGPVTDSAGRVLGINTHRPGEGFYLARSATAELRDRVEALSRGESPSRRRLGVALAPPHAARRLRAAVGLAPRDGLLVRDVAEGSPAETGGLRKGDLIVAAAGQPVGSLDALMSAVDRVAEGASLELTVVRGTDEVTVAVSF